MQSYSETEPRIADSHHKISQHLQERIKSYPSGVNLFRFDAERCVTSPNRNFVVQLSGVTLHAGQSVVNT